MDTLQTPHTPDLATLQKQYEEAQAEYANAREACREWSSEVNRLSNLIESKRPMNTYVIRYKVGRADETIEIDGHFLYNTHGKSGVTIYRYNDNGCKSEVARFSDTISIITKSA